MDQPALDLLSKHRVCSLTTLLIDGSPHAAALHFSHAEDPLELYFSTENNSKKCENLLEGKTVLGSVVLGFSEDEWLTLQMDGVVRAVTEPEELSQIQTIHYKKHPNSEQYKDDPATLFLKFSPRWWRYTDYNTKPPTILSSEK